MRFVHRNGRIVKATDKSRPRPWAVSVISDNMEPLRHHGTGRVIDSKSKFRADTRACGAVEVGNEPINPRKRIELDRGQRREAVRRAIYELRNR